MCHYVFWRFCSVYLSSTLLLCFSLWTKHDSHSSGFLSALKIRCGRRKRCLHQSCTMRVQIEHFQLPGAFLNGVYPNMFLLLDMIFTSQDPTLTQSPPHPPPFFFPQKQIQFFLTETYRQLCTQTLPVSQQFQCLFATAFCWMFQLFTFLARLIPPKRFFLMAPPWTALLCYRRCHYFYAKLPTRSPHLLCHRSGGGRTANCAA